MARGTRLFEANDKSYKKLWRKFFAHRPYNLSGCAWLKAAAIPLRLAVLKVSICTLRRLTISVDRSRNIWNFDPSKRCSSEKMFCTSLYLRKRASILPLLTLETSPVIVFRQGWRHLSTRLCPSWLLLWKLPTLSFVFLALPVWIHFSSKTSSFSSFSKIFCTFAATSYDILRAVITSSSSCSGPTVSGESYFIGFFASGDVVESSEESDDLNVLLLSRLLKNSAISHRAKCKVCGQSHRRSLLRHYSTQFLDMLAPVFSQYCPVLLFVDFL